MIALIIIVLLILWVFGLSPLELIGLIILFGLFLCFGMVYIGCQIIFYGAKCIYMLASYILCLPVRIINRINKYLKYIHHKNL